MTQQRAKAGETADLLLTTLQLHADAEAAALRERWAVVDYAGLAALSEYEGCVLWLFRRLRELNLLEVVPALYAQWLSTRAHNLEARNLLVDAQRDDVVSILNDMRVPHVLLKGAARRLLGDRYPYVDARTTSDVDVLLPAHLALSTWERLRDAGFHSAAIKSTTYDGHFHLPPLRNGKVVAVELHTSTSAFVAPAVAWERIARDSQAVTCWGGPTLVPSATELLWHAITHAPIPEPDAFRLRFLQDAETVLAARDIDWHAIGTRLASDELPHRDLTFRWLGTAARLSERSGAVELLGHLPVIDFAKLLRWRLRICRMLDTNGAPAADHVWGSHPVSRGRRLLIDQGTRAELSLRQLLPPPGTPALRRIGRRVAAGAARACYAAWQQLGHT